MILNFNDALLDIIKDVTRDIASHTVQLFTLSGLYDRPIPYATGILLRTKNKYYILSAGHIANDLRDNKILIIDSDTYNFIEGEAELIDPQKSAANDIIDLVCISPSKSLISNLQSQYRFLDYQNVLLGHEVINEQRYLIFGFPSSYSRINPMTKGIKPRAFSFLTKPINSGLYEKMDYSKRFNYLLHYSRKSTFRYTEEGTLTGPKPYGLSGSGLWFLPEYNIEKGETVPHSLVGIMTEFNNKYNALIGTKIGIANEQFNLNI